MGRRGIRGLQVRVGQKCCISGGGGGSKIEQWRYTGWRSQERKSQ